MSDDLLLVGIFDGHGGSEAVDFVAGCLPELLTCWLKESGGGHDLKDVMRRTFQDVNERLTRVQMKRELEKMIKNGDSKNSQRIMAQNLIKNENFMKKYDTLEAKMKGVKNQFDYQTRNSVDNRSNGEHHERYGSDDGQSYRCNQHQQRAESC